MRTSTHRARVRRSVPKKIVRTNPEAPLARVVPQLAPETLHALIRHRGLDASAELVAAATPAQLTAVFDIDLWRRSQSGRDERFDDDRFGEWLEALVESGELLAARTIASLDEHLVTAGFSRYVRVLDPATLPTAIGWDGEINCDAPSFSGLSREIGGYVVHARRTDAWDAVVALLVALAEHHPHRFHVVMRGCRLLSNSKPEIDGLDDLLTAPEQLLHDVMAARDDRRSQQGYVTPADARAFLQMARQRRPVAGAARPINPIAAAYFRAVDDREPVAPADTVADHANFAATRPQALLAAPADETPHPAEVEALLREIGDGDETAFAARSRELAFLANVLMAGGSVQSRAFTPREASEAAIAICNLGLEHRAIPGALSADHDLVAAFQTGWALLHELSLFVARQLIDVLADLRCVDAVIQEDLHLLRRELVRQCENGTPWRARGSLDAIAMIDMPTCVSLQALLDECPVLPEALTAVLERRQGGISPTAFEFISTGSQIQKVQEFAERLLELLMQ